MTKVKVKYDPDNGFICDGHGDGFDTTVIDIESGVISDEKIDGEICEGEKCIYIGENGEKLWCYADDLQEAKEWIIDREGFQPEETQC